MATTSKVIYDPNAKYDFTTKDLEYLRHPGIKLQARIYRPEGEGPFHAIMDIHGGAWTTGDRFQNTLIDEVYAESGLLVVALDHRLSPKYPYPAQVQDVNFGIRWAKAHLEEWGGIVETLGAMGTSSGGHILMLNQMKPKDPVLNAIPYAEHPELDCKIGYYIGLWVPIDPLARYLYQRDQGGQVKHLVKNSEDFFGSEETMKEANPQTVLDRNEFEYLPPAMLIEPYPDTFVPEEIPQKFVDTYKAKGGYIEKPRFEGVPHGFARTDTAQTQHALNEMKKFIAARIAELQG